MAIWDDWETHFCIFVTPSRNTIPCYKNHLFCHARLAGALQNKALSRERVFQKSANLPLRMKVTKIGVMGWGEVGDW